jgi:hypothetical protein
MRRKTRPRSASCRHRTGQVPPGVRLDAAEGPIEIINVHAIDTDAPGWRVASIFRSQGFEEVPKLDIAPHPSREPDDVGERLCRGLVLP